MRVERKLVAGEVETVEVQETLERVKDLAKGGNQEYISQYQYQYQSIYLAISMQWGGSKTSARKYQDIRLAMRISGYIKISIHIAKYGDISRQWDRGENEIYLIHDFIPRCFLGQKPRRRVLQFSSDRGADNFKPFPPCLSKPNSLIVVAQICWEQRKSKDAFLCKWNFYLYLNFKLKMGLLKNALLYLYLLNGIVSKK